MWRVHCGKEIVVTDALAKNSDFTLSLVIITKNPCMEWLENSLDVIESQTWTSFVVVVVDASNSVAKQQIAQLIESKPEIQGRSRLFDQQSIGLWHAFEEAFSYCHGDVIGVINSDDYLADKNVISDIVEIFSNSSAEYIYGNSMRIDSMT